MTRRRDVYERRLWNLIRRWYRAFSPYGWPWWPLPLERRDLHGTRHSWRKAIESRRARPRREAP